MKVKTLLLNAVLCTSFTVTDNQNMCDQIMGDSSSKCVSSYCILCIPYIRSGSPNKSWLHTCDTCVITTWAELFKAGLRYPRITTKFEFRFESLKLYKVFLLVLILFVYKLMIGSSKHNRENYPRKCF